MEQNDNHNNGESSGSQSVDNNEPFNYNKAWLDKIGVCGILRLEVTEPYARLISGLCKYKYQAVGFYFMITDERGSNYSVYLFNSYDGVKPSIVSDGNSSLFLLLTSGNVKRIEAESYTGNSQEFVNALMHVTSQNLRNADSKIVMSTDSFHEQCCHRISGLSYQHNQSGDKMVARVINLLKRKKKEEDRLFNPPVIWESNNVSLTTNSRKDQCQQLLLKLVDVFYSEEGQRLDLASKFAASVAGDVGSSGLSLAKSSALEQLLQTQNKLLQQLIEIKQSGVLRLQRLDENINSLQQIATKLGTRKLDIPDRSNQSCVWFVDRCTNSTSAVMSIDIHSSPTNEVSNGSSNIEVQGKILLNDIRKHITLLMNGEDLDATDLLSRFNDLVGDTGIEELETNDIPVRHCLVRTEPRKCKIDRMIVKEVQQRFHVDLCSQLTMRELEHLSNEQLFNLSRYLDSLDDPNMIGTINNIIALMARKAERLVDSPDD